MVEWELNQNDKEVLRSALITRIKSAVTKFLLYTQGGGGSPSQERIDWCTGNLQNVDTLAVTLSRYVMSEPAFIAGGTSIDDSAIQSRIEAVMVSFFMPA